MANFTSPTPGKQSGEKKRKREGNDDDHGSRQIEIDVNAPEPASKKTLRRAKRAKATSIPDQHKSVPIKRKKPEVEKGALEPKAVLGRSPYGIWIGNLPFFVTKKDLQEFITADADNAISSDEITRIHLPTGPPKPGAHFQNKGFAYVDLLSAQVVERALRLSEKLVGGRRVLIKGSKDFHGRPETTSKTSTSTGPSSKRIFVGNLEFEVSKEDLEQHFRICGPIHDVHVATFEDSGRCKGYAWVEFEKLSSAVTAMRGWLEARDTFTATEKEGTAVDANSPKKMTKRIWVNKMGGRKLHMEFAEDKTTRYNKRFGKGAHVEGLENVMATDADRQEAIGQGSGTPEVDGDVEQAKLSTQKPRGLARSQRVPSGYSITSVQKMTGAITEGRGTKTRFE